ncbi:hypothetical protein CC2G_008813 [Coprinopsis cinerea AmutBmut pab1-1]|nr:hypothetical protein CC2G_008813 [Coprinopsis cinerea AmutBmut pab1-1]
MFLLSAAKRTESFMEEKNVEAGVGIDVLCRAAAWFLVFRLVGRDSRSCGLGVRWSLCPNNAGILSVITMAFPACACRVRPPI